MASTTRGLSFDAALAHVLKISQLVVYPAAHLLYFDSEIYIHILSSLLD